MSLRNGQYKITSLVGNPIGRHPIEDKSGNPKRVLALPKNFREPRIWQIEQIAGGKYQLKTGGAVVGKQSDNLVWAFLIKEEIEHAEWRITHVPQHGENAYIIETPDLSAGEGWVASEGEEYQVAVRPLVSTRSLPPMFPPTEVFDIVRVPDSDAA